jgi:biopolymer transport protein ExbB
MLDIKRKTPLIALVGAVALMVSAPAFAQDASAPAAASSQAAPADAAAAPAAAAPAPEAPPAGRADARQMFLDARSLRSS